MDQLLKNEDKKRISLVVLLDTSKAFDSIQHDNLLSKLHSLAVWDSTLAWFKSYLSSCKQVVRIGSVPSEPLPLTVSVGQGSILGPVLLMLSTSFSQYLRNVVEMSVTVNNNSPAEDYVHPDDHTQPTDEMTPGFKPFTV